MRVLSHTATATPCAAAAMALGAARHWRRSPGGLQLCTERSAAALQRGYARQELAGWRLQHPQSGPAATRHSVAQRSATHTAACEWPEIPTHAHAPSYPDLKVGVAFRASRRASTRSRASDLQPHTHKTSTHTTHKFNVNRPESGCRVHALPDALFPGPLRQPGREWGRVLVIEYA